MSIGIYRWGWSDGGEGVAFWGWIGGDAAIPRSAFVTTIVMDSNSAKIVR